MNTSDCKSLALQALEQSLVNNSAARRVARAYFPPNADESSLPVRAVLDTYEQHEARIQAAMEWVRKQED